MTARVAAIDRLPLLPGVARAGERVVARSVLRRLPCTLAISVLGGGPRPVAVNVLGGGPRLVAVDVLRGGPRLVAIDIAGGRLGALPCLRIVAQLIAAPRRIDAAILERRLRAVSTRVTLRVAPTELVAAPILRGQTL